MYIAHVCDNIEGAKIPSLVCGQQHQTAMLSYFKIPRSHSLVFVLQLFTLLGRIAEPIPFLPPSFTPPEISLFWKTSIAITPSGTQKAVPTPVGRKYSTGSSPLISFLSITLTYLLFPVAFQAVATPLISSLQRNTRLFPLPLLSLLL